MTRAAGIDSPSVRVLFGRERELAALLAALQEPAHGVITVTGVPGVGKSRLVAEACERLTAADHGAAAVVPLSGIEDAASIPAAVAVARQSMLRDGSVPRGVRVLVLEDTEHLTGASELVQQIVLESPGTQVVVTGTSRLGVADERVLRLGPLGAGREVHAATSPTSTATRDLDDDPAVQLFRHRAAAAVVGFRTTDEETQQIAQLCDLLGGLPLAIELAAARAATFPPAALLAQLRGAAGLDLLREQHPGVGPARHRTMRDALDWSVDLLEPRLRQAAVALAVFAGGFTVSAAAAVAGLADDSEGLEVLGALVDCHLVEPLADSRFVLQPLVRRFLADRLALSGRAEEVRERHTDEVMRSARIARAAYERGDHATAFALLDANWPEVSAVCARLLDQQRVEQGLELVVGTAPFLLYVAVDPVAHTRLERFIELGRRDAPDSPLLTRALLWSAVLTRLTADSRFDAGWVRGRIAEGMARARAAGDDAAVDEGLEFIAMSATVTGDLADAESAVAEGIRRADGHDDGRLARFEAWACMLAHHRGDLAEAERLGHSALGRAQRRGDAKATLLAAIALLGLPEVDVQSLPPVDELVELARKIGNRHAEGFLLAVEASRLLVTGDDRGASSASAAHVALLIARGESDTVSLGFTVSVLVAVAAHRGDYVQAAELYGSIERLGDAVTLTSTPAKRKVYQAALDTVEAALGPQRWNAHRRHGAVLTPAEAAAAGLDYAATVLAAPERPRGVLGAALRLSPREAELLRAVAAGRTNKQIATLLGLTPKTVMHYVSRLYDKLGVANRAAATAWAARSGILDDPPE